MLSFAAESISSVSEFAATFWWDKGCPWLGNVNAHFYKTGIIAIYDKLCSIFRWRCNRYNGTYGAKHSDWGSRRRWVRLIWFGAHFWCKYPSRIRCSYIHHCKMMTKGIVCPNDVALMVKNLHLHAWFQFKGILVFIVYVKEGDNIKDKVSSLLQNLFQLMRNS